jgi:hypothetical protein
MNPEAAMAQTVVLEHILTKPSPPGAPGLVRGLIVSLLESGEIQVVVPPDADTRLRCDFLETAASSTLRLIPGDVVLLMPPAAPGQNGCVLGRVGRYRDPQQQPAPAERVVIEAGEALTLRCGESSVEMRQDGKILIRGNDVVTRGEHTAKIKAGTVEIN